MALTTWLLAAYVLPGLHLLGHEDDHVHVAGVVVTTHAHEDLDRYFDDDFDWDDEEEEQEPTAPPSAPWSHAAGSSAHGVLSALSSPFGLTLTPPPPAPDVERGATVARRAEPGRERPRARSPPVISVA